MENESKPIEYFKDWSNYLLVTTVASLGWTASKNCPDFSTNWIKRGCIWSLGLSAILGILTLALIPLVAEQRQSGDISFYDVNIKFRLLFFSFKKMRLKYVCLPQHALFILGILLFIWGI